MSDPSLASIDDLSSRLPANSGTVDATRATAALIDASAVVRLEAGEDWLDDDGVLETVPDMVVAVTCASAARAYLWSGNVMSEQVGSWSAQYASREDALSLTPSEKRLIRRALTGSTGIGSVELESPFTTVDATYADVTGTDEQFPIHDGDVGY